MYEKQPIDIQKYLLTGGIIGAGAVLLSYLGNPANTGLCISCFMENVAGSFGLHDNVRMQYLRPEIIGLVLGAFLASLASREFFSSGGSSPILRFLIGIFIIIGCSVFIGCPIKLFLRLAAGDLSASAGLIGLIVGVYIGLEFIENGFRLGKANAAPPANGFILPLLFAFLLLLSLAAPSLLRVSAKGAAALHAPWLISLAVGLLIGVLAQRSQFCITGGIARLFLWGPREVLNCPRSSGLLISIGAFILAAFFVSFLTGQFSLGLHGQPSSNENYGWNFLGMVLVGIGSVLIKGCPLRQLIMSGQGDNDAAVTVMGMLVGAAMTQNWDLRGNAAGTPVSAQIAVLVGIAVLLLIGIVNRRRGYGIAPEYQTGLD